jgi:hypothetical protein
MELQGKVKVLNETKTFGDKGFRKRELVIETDEQYKQTILIEFTQDKTDLLNAYKVGDNVKVGINIGGREWVNPQGETKYFNSITGWRIEKAGDNQAPKPFEPAPFESDNDDNDLLPF